MSHSQSSPNLTGGERLWRDPTQPALHDELMERTLATQTGMSNDWLKSQGLISVRDLWMKTHGYA